ncbi:transcriptional regulator for cryptic hemolysin [Xanthomonas oryzae pv. oryzicola BLS256]|uniref:Transcriptional regulator for cryptic hemolysin n=1 Tax=Xanthomonas oryzae pv. oryzicola (strain BLS256) TaxID=383407 RepID=G7TK24_XANOB|nr:transcriptional regulator for cryptic hemolysin [Xanthomonas oryzae pv. oryzicola BLS256]QEO96997.1 transcriptional regulator for cryptic hemolysin [Xanthomonas oryzae pv. oryzicola]
MLDQNELIHPQAAVAPGYLANHAARVFNRLAMPNYGRAALRWR